MCVAVDKSRLPKSVLKSIEKDEKRKKETKPKKNRQQQQQRLATSGHAETSSAETKTKAATLTAAFVRAELVTQKEERVLSFFK